MENSAAAMSGILSVYEHTIYRDGNTTNALQKHLVINISKTKYTFVTFKKPVGTYMYLRIEC